MESRKGEPVDLNAMDVRSGRNNVQIEIELIYLALKNLTMFKIFQCGDTQNSNGFDVSFRNEKYTFIFN